MRYLLWFHSLERKTVHDLLGALSDSARPPPTQLSQSTDNELALGISGPCVYAYLGHASEAFGDTTIAIDQSHLSGTVTPFDTGGLRRHIVPVNEWDDDDKAEYLSQYSFPHSQLTARLAEHPSTGAMTDYLRGARPGVPGPHEYWTGKRAANIWAEEQNQWQAWTWEIRSHGQLPLGNGIHRWSCPTATYDRIQRFADDNLDMIEFFEFLFPLYVAGGAGCLLQELQEYQAQT